MVAGAYCESVSGIIICLRWQLLLLLVVPLLGCGGTEREQAEQSTYLRATTTSAAQTPSKQEYIAQGDAICADVRSEATNLLRQAQELQAQGDELPKAEFLKRAASFWSEQIRVMKSFRGEFARLGAPAGDEQRVEQFLQSIDGGIAIAREMKATLASGQEVPASTVEEYGQTVDRGNTLAQGYGFQVCGRSEQP
jgi:hypothetical protein